MRMDMAKTEEHMEKEKKDQKNDKELRKCSK